MITTEASSTTMSWATAITARARKRLGSAPGSGRAGSGVGWLRSIVEVIWVSVSWEVRLRSIPVPSAEPVRVWLSGSPVA